MRLLLRTILQRDHILDYILNSTQNYLIMTQRENVCDFGIEQCMSEDRNQKEQWIIEFASCDHYGAGSTTKRRKEEKNALTWQEILWETRRKLRISSRKGLSSQPRRWYTWQEWRERWGARLASGCRRPLLGQVIRCSRWKPRSFCSLLPKMHSSHIEHLIWLSRIKSVSSKYYLGR